MRMMGFLGAATVAATLVACGDGGGANPGDGGGARSDPAVIEPVAEDLGAQILFSEDPTSTTLTFDDSQALLDEEPTVEIEVTSTATFALVATMDWHDNALDSYPTTLNDAEGFALATSEMIRDGDTVHYVLAFFDTPPGTYPIGIGLPRGAAMEVFDTPTASPPLDEATVQLVPIRPLTADELADTTWLTAFLHGEPDDVLPPRTFLADRTFLAEPVGDGSWDVVDGVLIEGGSDGSSFRRDPVGFMELDAFGTLMIGSYGDLGDAYTWVWVQLDV